MYNKSILVCSVYCLFIVSAFANTLPDSSATVGGKKVIVHTIEPKETWYSLSRKFGVNVTELQAANNSKDLKIGQTVIIPKAGSGVVAVTKAEKSTAFISKPAVMQQTENVGAATKYHVVEKGQTMFGISKKYNVTVAHIREWNNLTDDNVKLGQKLLVSKPSGNTPIAMSAVTPAAKPSKNTATANSKESALDRIERLANQSIINKELVPASEKPIETKPVAAKTATIIKPAIVSEVPAKPIEKVTEEAAAPKKEEIVKQKEVVETTAVTPKDNFTPKKEITEKGTAAWINDEDVNPNKYYALHRTAPIGTIIKVTNTMNNQNVFVKVVGALPDTGDNSNLIIKISKAAAKKMDVLDAKFQAELSYGITQ
jgi:LysM repeat protein